MKTVVIEAQLRDSVGKKSASQLRKEDLVPCVLYGAETPIHFQAHYNVVRHVIYTNVFLKAEIKIGENTYSAIVKDTQFDALTDKIRHIDFLSLVPNKPFRANVPLRLVGVSKGVKEGGSLVQKIRKISIVTTPEAVLEAIEVDITPLELGKSLRVRDIVVNADTTILSAPAIPIITIDIPRALRSAQTKAVDTKKGKKK
jgi:large subunit ribosomal protein L25